jgi:hypothetical protein
MTNPLSIGSRSSNNPSPSLPESGVPLAEEEIVDDISEVDAAVEANTQIKEKNLQKGNKYLYVLRYYY